LVEIADLGSMNGTLLNGARVVAAHIVEDGDLIRVGRTEFRVRFGDSA
jgi:pSer/pThr/pTyr-binding forkhead associated (FHA) protein